MSSGNTSSTDLYNIDQCTLILSSCFLLFFLLDCFYSWAAAACMSTWLLLCHWTNSWGCQEKMQNREICCVISCTCYDCHLWTTAGLALPLASSFQISTTDPLLSLKSVNDRGDSNQISKRQLSDVCQKSRALEQCIWGHWNCLDCLD